MKIDLIFHFRVAVVLKRLKCESSHVIRELKSHCFAMLLCNYSFLRIITVYKYSF